MTSPIGERPLKRLEGLLPGLHLHFDVQPCDQVEDDCGLLVRIRHDDTQEGGGLIVTVVHPDGEDAGVEMDVREMAGTFERV